MGLPVPSTQDVMAIEAQPVFSLLSAIVSVTGRCKAGGLHIRRGACLRVRAARQSADCETLKHPLGAEWESEGGRELKNQWESAERSLHQVHGVLATTWASEVQKGCLDRPVCLPEQDDGARLPSCGGLGGDIFSADWRRRCSRYLQR